MTLLINPLQGLLLPQSALESQFFAVLATLVALNTVVYAAISIAHIVPRWLKASWFRKVGHRSETRSIYPDGPL